VRTVYVRATPGGAVQVSVTVTCPPPGGVAVVASGHVGVAGGTVIVAVATLEESPHWSVARYVNESCPMKPVRDV
jgi:hypothetical protein